MQETQDIIRHIAPTLAAALDGPFAGVAYTFMLNHLLSDSITDGRNPRAIIDDLLKDTKKLQTIKEIDQQFALEMEKLDVDVFSLQADGSKDAKNTAHISSNPQMFISIIFLVAYFAMLAAIFAVEASDTLNMKQGENSLMGEMQILFGVLTAGVGQILSYWFGGVLKGKGATSAGKTAI